MKVKGGKELGCGVYGCVYTFEPENHKQVCELHFVDGEGKCGVINIDVNQYIDYFQRNNIVFKSFKPNTSYQDQQDEYEMFRSIAILKIPNSVLYTTNEDYLKIKNNITLTYIKFNILNSTLYYPIMRQMDGNLSSVIEVMKTKKNSIFFRDYITYFNKLEIDVGNFLYKLHEQKNYHFDMKLENILYKIYNDNFEFCVGDYGFIRNTATIGTPTYVSPLLFNDQYEYIDYNSHTNYSIATELVNNVTVINFLKDLKKDITDGYFNYMHNSIKIYLQNNPSESYNHMRCSHADYFALGIVILNLICELYNTQKYSLQLLLNIRYTDTFLRSYIIHIIKTYIVF